MFSTLRRRSRRPEPVPMLASPSLPELNDELGIPWPEELVDVAAVQQAKVSFQGSSRGTVPYHLPFRDHSDRGHISALYTASPPPSAFANRQVVNGNVAATTMTTTTPGRYSQRRARVVPTFNLLVAGGKGAGKTSLARLLLESADVSPGATVDQRAVLDRYLKGRARPTREIQTVCLEIWESRFERVLLSVVDTPGLEFGEGKELKLERQVNGIVKYLDAQFADTMSEESKVVRQSRGDQHIHLCIYVIDPVSIMTADERRATSTLPAHPRSKATATLSNHAGAGIISDESEDEEDEPLLTMSPAEIRVIRRLSTRCNVLPVVGHADSLTDEKLQAVKQAVRRSMVEAGLDFGVFDTANGTPKLVPEIKVQFAIPTTNGDGCHRVNGEVNIGRHDHDEAGESGERQGRSVIKLRTGRVTRSRSRGRRDLALVAAEEDCRPVSPESGDPESLANVRFSANALARIDLVGLLPFAVIAPEGRRKEEWPMSADNINVFKTSDSAPLSDEDAVPQTPASTNNQSVRLPYRDGPPDDLRGVFTRKFRWGVVDALDPNHCDFAALRTAILSSHLKLLKSHTKEVLYEKYRTEKLLARRATQNISDEDRQRLLEDLGL